MVLEFMKVEQTENNWIAIGIYEKVEYTMLSTKNI